MSQLERAARALHALNDAASEPKHRVTWEECLPRYREVLMAEARAVIASIEPDDAMVRAAHEAANVKGVGPSDDYCTWNMTEAALKAGLRALLAEGEGR